MNKRIKKKRRKLRVIRVGDHVYTHKEIVMVNKVNIGFMNTLALYQKIKDYKLIRPRVKALINYIYKNRMKCANRLRFEPQFLNEPTRPFASNSCEAMSMEVD